VPIPEDAHYCLSQPATGNWRVGALVPERKSLSNLLRKMKGPPVGLTPGYFGSRGIMHRSAGDMIEVE
jgi:hypothetical protein